MHLVANARERLPPPLRAFKRVTATRGFEHLTFFALLLVLAGAQICVGLMSAPLCGAQENFPCGP